MRDKEAAETIRKMMRIRTFEQDDAVALSRAVCALENKEDEDARKMLKIPEMVAAIDGTAMMLIGNIYVAEELCKDGKFFDRMRCETLGYVSGVQKLAATLKKDLFEMMEVNLGDKDIC